MKAIRQWGLIGAVMSLAITGCDQKRAAESAAQNAADLEPGSVIVARALPEPTVIVHEGESIQKAVDAAAPGDIIGIEPGIYHETVLIEKPNITLRGLIRDGRRPILDGTRPERGEAGKVELLPDGVQAKGVDNLVVEGFRFQNYQGNGVVVSDCDGLVLRDLVVSNAGLYGVYPVGCRNVLVEDCVVSGCSDSGIYVGQSEDCVVRNNECFSNVAGLEIENTTRALVENNSCHHNTAGILVFVLPNLRVKTGSDTIIRSNRVWANNLPNWGAEGSTVGQVPYGSGMMILAADRTVVSDNEIWDNDSFGVAVLSLEDMRLPKKVDVEPHSDGTRVVANIYRNNGSNPHEVIMERQIPVGTDLVWNGQGVGNCWTETTRNQFPPGLPACP